MISCILPRKGNGGNGEILTNSDLGAAALSYGGAVFAQEGGASDNSASPA